MRLGVMVGLAGLGLGLAFTGPLAAFEGSITFHISHGKGQVHDLTMTMSGEKMRTEMDEGGKNLGVSIIDGHAHTVTILMRERKTYMVSSFEPGKMKATSHKGTFHKTGATERIAGYPTQEWIYDSGKSVDHVWLTDKLGAGFLQSGKSSPLDFPSELRNKGMALRVTSDKGFTMEAVKVEPGSPEASLFEVPSGYTKMEGMGALDGGASGGMSADTQARMKQAMENMTPEQKAMVEKMMQSQGAAH